MMSNRGVCILLSRHSHWWHLNPLCDYGLHNNSQIPIPFWMNIAINSWTQSTHNKLLHPPKMYLRAPLAFICVKNTAGIWRLHSLTPTSLTSPLSGRPGNFKAHLINSIIVWAGHKRLGGQTSWLQKGEYVADHVNRSISPWSWVPSFWTLIPRHPLCAQCRGG